MIDYENVVWTNSNRTLLTLNFQGDSLQYAPLPNAESQIIVDCAVKFDVLQASLYNMQSYTRVLSRALANDVQNGKYDSILTKLNTECEKTKTDLLFLNTTLDATKVVNQRLTNLLQQLRMNLQQTSNAVEQMRDSITKAFSPNFTPPKRRFWKEEQKMKSGFSQHFSRA